MHTIGEVIDSFRAALPEIAIYVFDNNSSDRTGAVAKDHAAEVIRVSLRGKGNVVRRMFADVEADIYVMVDGDGTYHAPSVRSLIDKLIDERLDMVVGSRKVHNVKPTDAYRIGHQFGNRMLTGAVKGIFGGQFTDMLSGYRVFSRRYAKSFPALSQGFETETELTVHALELRMPYGEHDTPYGSRPDGSHSKLSTYRDGWRILKTIIALYIYERPLAFFSITAVILALMSVILGTPIVIEFLETGLVPRFPTLILASSLMLCATLSFICGLLLNTVTLARQEMKRLFYLNIPRGF